MKRWFISFYLGKQNAPKVFLVRQDLNILIHQKIY